MKIIEFRAENFMRLQVVQITPEGHLIQITGANGQGKTSTIDAIWGALGGTDALPADPIHAGKASARIEVKLGDREGVRLIVERTFTAKGTYLSVKSPDGGKFSKPQQMMNELMGAIGFDPLHFMRLGPKEQFAMLRNIVKLDVDVDALDRQRLSIYEARTALSRSLISAKARMDAIVVPPDLPEVAPNIDNLTRSLIDAGKRNDTVKHAKEIIANAEVDLGLTERELEKAEQHVAKLRDDCARSRAGIESMKKQPLPDEIDLLDIMAQIDAAKPVIEGFRKLELRIAAEGEHTSLQREYEEKTNAIAEIDRQKAAAIADAQMPVAGLSFHVPEGAPLKDGVVAYKGHPLSQASGAEQLKVSAAIGAALNPKLRVLLCRDGSLLDKKSLGELNAFAEANDMQIFLERVDESGEIGIVIEDGHVKGQEELVAAFLREEQAGPAEAEAEPKPVDDPERLARAGAFLDAQLEKLKAANTARDCDTLNASVKHMLRSFPTLIAERWNPQYLEAIKSFERKKVKP